LRASLEADFVRVRNGAVSESEFTGDVEKVQQGLEDSARKSVEAAKSKFRGKIEFRVLHGDATEELARRARTADLIVIGQPSSDGAARDYSVSADIVIASGLPIVLAPAQGSFAKIGRRILIAWKHARETTRALRDALPLLAKADQVTVLNIEPEHERKTLAVAQADVEAMLARHGVEAKLEVAKADGREVHEILLAKAADMNADLLVMGAYRRSRFREMLTGGVTHRIMTNMTLPVLMSH
jgi:nucleotide-binding universal stress UspA family protein